jgi:hypothetical protein
MQLFTAPEAWYGSTFELTLDLGRAASADRFLAATDALWSHPLLDGCYLDAEREPAEQARVAPSDILPGLTPDTGVSTLRGVATLPNRARTVCLSTALMFPRDEEGSDQLILALPLGALARAYPIGAYPIDDQTPLDWRPALEDWMTDLASRAWEPGRVRIATIGAGTAPYFQADAVLKHGIPTERWEAYLVAGPNGRPQLHRANMPAPLSFP